MLVGSSNDQFSLVHLPLDAQDGTQDKIPAFRGEFNDEQQQMTTTVCMCNGNGNDGAPTRIYGACKWQTNIISTSNNVNHN